MKYQMVEVVDEHGTEEVLGEYSTADFATQVVQTMRDMDPEGDYRIRTVA